LTFDDSGTTGTSGEVVELPGAQTPSPEPTPSPPGRAHGLAIGGMALCAMVGIAAFFAFATIGWSEGPRRVVVGVFLFSILGFVTCASAAVFTAARESRLVRPHS
jgi:predicted lipid-binding transport protein (Tim44 family)